MSICRLCINDRKLCDSHIISEFFYEPLYDEKHRIERVSANSHVSRKPEQKGIREKLLCSDCENFLGRYEGYWRRVFLGPQVHGVGLVGNKFTGLDYAKLKLLQLSILWRAGISRESFFREVNLGPHEEKLRQMILNEKPGTASEYPCLMSAITHENQVVDGLIIQPTQIRFESHTCYQLITGGLLWIFFVSSHAPTADVMEWVLHEDGTWKMLRDELGSLPLIQRIVSDLGAAGKLPSQRNGKKPI